MRTSQVKIKCLSFDPDKDGCNPEKYADRQDPCSTLFEKRVVGNCPTDQQYIGSKAECAQAARALALIPDDGTAQDAANDVSHLPGKCAKADGSGALDCQNTNSDGGGYSASFKPKGCYWKLNPGELYYNNVTTDESNSNDRVSLCKATLGVCCALCYPYQRRRSCYLPLATQYDLWHAPELACRAAPCNAYGMCSTSTTQIDEAPWRREWKRGKLRKLVPAATLRPPQVSERRRW